MPSRRILFGLVLAGLACLPSLVEAQLGEMTEEPLTPVLAPPSGPFVTSPVVLGTLGVEAEAEAAEAEEAREARELAPLSGATAPREPLAPAAPPAESTEEADPEPEPPRVPRIPEPMVFDLVRGLGARQWEVEANSLFQMPIDPENLHLAWAPEIELALADGFAIEIELPMRNENVEALKAAAQLTFGTGLDGRFIHGTQAIVEYELAHEALQTSLLYLAGIELDPTWSMLVMAGLRTTAGPDPFGIEVLLNGNLFAQVADILVLGLEVNYASDLLGGQSLLVMPQAHIDIVDHLRVQLGVGLSAEGEQRAAVVGSRVIVEL